MNKIKVVVESPRGTENKYVYESAGNLFRLKKTLPAGLVFPFDFGFLPNTRGEDGDPLDVMILSETKNEIGDVVECRLVGAIMVIQTDTRKNQTIRNDRFLAIPLDSNEYPEHSIEELQASLVESLKDFFIKANVKEHKILEFPGILNAGDAMEMVKTSME